MRRKQSIWTKKDDGTFIKATTTFLVENVFGSLFTEQMNKSIDTTVSIGIILDDEGGGDFL